MAGVKRLSKYQGIKTESIQDWKNSSFKLKAAQEINLKTKLEA